MNVVILAIYMYVLTLLFSSLVLSCHCILLCPALMSCAFLLSYDMRAVHHLRSGLYRWLRRFGGQQATADLRGDGSGTR